MPQLDMGVGVAVGELERSAVSGFCFWRLPAFPEGIAVLHPGRCTSRVSLYGPAVVLCREIPVAGRLGAFRCAPRKTGHPAQHCEPAMLIPAWRSTAGSVPT